MPLYFRRQDLPELAGLSDAEADRRLRAAQDKLGLKTALKGSALFAALTLLGIVIGRAFGQQMYGAIIGWLAGFGAYGLFKLNAARPFIERADTPRE